MATRKAKQKAVGASQGSDFNFFDSAAVIQSTTPAAGGAPKTDAQAVEGLEEYAALRHIEKLLSGELETRKGRLDEWILGHFAKNGCATHICPANPHGIEGDGKASLQLNKKSSASALNEEAIALALNHELSVQTIVTAPETFIINPQYATSPEVIDVLNKAVNAGLKALGLKLPPDLIQRQPGVKKTVVTDTTLAEIFTRTDAKGEYLSVEVVTQLLATFGTPMIRPTYHGGTESAMELAKKVLATAAQQAAPKKGRSNGRGNGQAPVDLMTQLKASLDQG